MVYGKMRRSERNGGWRIGLRRTRQGWMGQYMSGLGWMLISSGLRKYGMSRRITCGSRSCRGTGMWWLNLRLVDGVPIAFLLIYATMFQAIHALGSQPSAVISSFLTRTALVSDYFFRVRVEAVYQLIRVRCDKTNAVHPIWCLHHSYCSAQDLTSNISVSSTC